MITLTLLHPLQPTPVRSWTFPDNCTIRIGRSSENQVVLYSAVVSRHHVELHQTDSVWEIVNLGTNGTYLDGKRIAKVSVIDGLIVQLARSGPRIQIHINQPARKPPSNSLDTLSPEDLTQPDLKVIESREVCP